MGSWKGRRVLVTGHTGFKGAWLSLLLLRLGARVSGFALSPSTSPSLYALLGLEREIESHIGDVRDEGGVEHVLEQTKPEFVFHLAAQALVRAGYDRPVETYATNVLGTAHVLQSARAADVSRVVVVTSDKCYRNDGSGRAFREDDPLGGNDPYSSSKAAAEVVTHAYAASYGSDAFRVASARAGNVIGGGDWSEDRLVPDIVRAVTAHKALLLRYPRAVRPWQHVLEPLNGYLMLAGAMSGSAVGGWNFGPVEREHATVEELARTLYRALGEEERIELDPGPHLHEAPALRLDSSKARNDLGWSSKLDVYDAIGWTAAWYAAVAGGESARDVTLRQIAEYERL
jgi:CDP-glucose 4,6-dehydratase